LLTALPTVVLGVGEGLVPFLDTLARLLEMHAEGLTPITRIAVLSGEKVRSLNGHFSSSGDNLAQGLAACLESVTTESRLEAARAGPWHVGYPGGHLATRVVLILNAEAAEEIEAALDALKTAAEQLRPPLPVRLTCVVLARGRSRGDLGFPLEQYLRECDSSRLEPVSLILLDRFRSDGGAIGQEDGAGNDEIRHVLAFLLLASLLPSAGEEHWLFQRPSLAGERAAGFTLGAGILVVPVREIEEALTCGLLADLLALTWSEPEAASEPERFLTAFHIEDHLAEAASLRRLFAGLPADLPGLDHPAGNRFAVKLHQGEIRLNLGKHHWKDWPERVADYDAKWGGVRLQEWQKSMRRRALLQAEELEGVLTRMLDAAVREGRGLVPLAQAVVQRARGLLEREWECEGARTEVPDPSLDGHRTELQTALQQMPSGWAVGVRCFLLLLLAAYATLAGVQGVWKPGSPPWAPLLIGAVGLVVMGITAWQAMSCWDRARKRIFKARDDYLDAIAAKYEGVLRSEAILILRELRKRILAQLDEVEEQLTVIERRLREVAGAAGQEARAFSPRRSTIVQPVIHSWSDLQRVAHDLWGERDLKPLLHTVLAGVPVTTYAEAWSRVQPQVSPVETRDVTGEADEGDDSPTDPLLQVLTGATGKLLREWMREARMRTLGYYLGRRFPSAAERAEWLARQVRELHAQGTRLLWPEVQHGARVWQMLPTGEEELQALSRREHPEKAESLEAPGILGTLSQQSVELTRGQP
jgi:hypothetical protein